MSKFSKVFRSVLNFIDPPPTACGDHGDCWESTDLATYRIYIGLSSAVRGVGPDTIQRRALSTIKMYFDGFTVSRGVGFWKGDREGVLIFTVAIGPDAASDGDTSGLIKSVASQLCFLCGQEAILVEHGVFSRLIYREEN